MRADAWVWRLAAALLLATPGAARAGESPVPDGAAMVVVVRPAEVLARPEFAPLRKPLDALWRREGSARLPLQEVERLTFVWLPSGQDAPAWLPKPTVLIQRATAPREGKPPAGAEKAVAVDDRTVALGDAAGLAAWEKARKATPGPPAWRGAFDALADRPGALGVDVRWLVDRWKPLMGDGQLTDGMLGPLFAGADALALGVGVDGGPALEAIADGRDEEAAGKAARAVEAALGRTRVNVRVARKADEPRLPEASRVLDLVEALLRAAEVTRDGRRVVLRSRPEFDLARLNEQTLGPLLAGEGPSAVRMASRARIRQIGQAMHRYVAEHNNKFPAAVVLGPDGKTPHSWRVELLPYLGHKDLYEQYRLDEEWDSPANRKVLEQMPDVFAYPGQEGGHASACYVVVGNQTMFPSPRVGTSLNSVTDGTSNTILVVSAQRDVPWTKPEDLAFDRNTPPELGGFDPGGADALMADGKARSLKKGIDVNLLRALFSRAGGEVVQSADEF